ncbi:MAG: DUF308 domain-containing protein [Patescibacteria group bacterium]|nr:DUF308 domain-containing protein [Patescibacteria group bacterium]
MEDHKSNGWLVLLGIVLIVLGLIALGSAVVTSLIVIALLGWILLIAGVVELIRTFTGREQGNFALHLVSGILRIILGLLLIFSPGIGIATITILLGLYFLVIGAFRLVISFFNHPSGWGWSLFSGLLTFILGLILLTHFPVSGAIFIGIFVGLDLIFVGLSTIFLAA